MKYKKLIKLFLSHRNHSVNCVFPLVRRLLTFVFKKSMWTLETYKEIYTRYQASSLCAHDFYSNEQITRSRFYYWKEKYLKFYKHGTMSGTQHHGIKDPSRESGFIPLFVSSIQLIYNTLFQLIKKFPSFP